MSLYPLDLLLFHLLTTARARAHHLVSFIRPLAQHCSVTCPCERSDNLIAARRRKLDKYAETKERLKGKGYQAHLDAFVVGSLGTWDPENDRLLPIVGIGRKYGTLFKKLCCRDAISGSYEVWAARCRRHFQRSFSS